MIAKISRGSSIRGLANYLHGPGRANEHVYAGTPGGQVIGGNLGVEGARTGEVWAADMQTVMQARAEVERPVWHMSLRLPEGDPVLSDQQWAQIGQEMGEKMGWAEHPWVMVRHGEDHVHIAVSRVGFDGQLWHGRHDFREAQKARQPIEERLGLQQTRTERRNSRALSEGEYSRGLRTGEVPPRETLQARVAAALSASEGLGREQFEQLLDQEQVLFKANVASTGRMSGYSFALPGNVNADGEQVWFKASQLARSFAWSKMSERLDKPLPEPNVAVPEKKLLETRTRHAERVEQAREEARQKDQQERRYRSAAQARASVQRTSTAQALRWRSKHLQSDRTKLPQQRAEREQARKAAAHIALAGRPSMRRRPPTPRVRATSEVEEPTYQRSYQDRHRYDPPRHSPSRGRGIGR